MVATILLAKPYIIFVSEDCFTALRLFQSFKVSLLRCFRVSSHLRCCFKVPGFTASLFRVSKFHRFAVSCTSCQLLISPLVHDYYKVSSLITHHSSLITYHLSLLAPISYPWHMLSNAGRRLSGIGSTGGETILRGSIGVPPFHTRKSR